jgi:ectoine hydroxylase-related dioxygenase (phytanoyl-CoA dioxygenase family)
MVLLGSTKPSDSNMFHDTLPMYQVPEDTKDVVQSLGLRQNIIDMQERGYTILTDVAPDEFNQHLRNAILRRKGGFCLINNEAQDDVFLQAATNPKMLALAEVMVGQGCLLHQVAGSVKRAPRDPDKHGMGLHSDQNWLPAPFPEHNQSLTCCWATDEYTFENGATRIVIGSHKRRRHPSQEEMDQVTDPSFATPIEAPANSIIVWDGSVWHTGGHRTNPGERVVLHVTYARICQRQIESYDHVTDETVERVASSTPWATEPNVIRMLLGRTGYFHRTADRKQWMPDGLFRDMIPMVKGAATREHILQTVEKARLDPALQRMRALEAQVNHLKAQLAAAKH